jgi:nucleotide-binding universal stress UspA family protein
VGILEQRKVESAMYKHILLPTDGSALSASAIESGVRLARLLGSRITGLHVMARRGANPLETWAHGDVETQVRLRELFDTQAQRYLAFVATAARGAGVECDCLRVSDESPAAAIVRTAEDRGCDLIYMASHGKAGASALLLGSETAKVLIQSAIPVLVHRQRVSVPIATSAGPALEGRADVASGVSAKRGAPLEDLPASAG